MADVVDFLNFRKLLNENKTEIILIKGNRRSKVVISHLFDILGSRVESKTSVKNLGVIINNDLNFKSHVDSITRKCGYHIRNLYAIKRFITRDLLIILVKALIISRIDFCNALYVGQPKYLIDRLQTVQNRCARLVCGLPPRSPTSAVIRSLHWLSMELRIIYKICLIVFKTLYYGKPLYLREILNIKPVKRGLRSGDSLTLLEPLPVTGTSFIERAFQFSGPRLFNKLPPAVRGSPTVISFKNRLKTHLFTMMP